MKVNPITNILRAGQIVGLDPREMVAIALDELRRAQEAKADE
ncbi:MAG TPA: hypothetical protein VNB03_13690 [Casimicrobiaceae bacterium]|nr:hypothetical protein [Casimicrobiaceae bacterium]